MSDDDFQAEDFEADELNFPYAPPQQWVVLNDQVSADELSVYTYLMAHMNPYNNKFHARPGRGRIAERFGKSLDWVDKRLTGLVKHGALTKQSRYWTDNRDHAKGTTDKSRDDAGVKRSQAPNKYVVHLKPAARERYTGPIKVKEYYEPHRIRERVEAYGGKMPETPGEWGAATQRPGFDQGKQDAEPADPAASEPPGGPPHSGPGGAATQRPGGPPHSGPKEHGGKEHGEEKDHKEPFGDTQKVPDLQKVYGETAGHSAYGETKQGELVSNHLHARARSKAGPAACQALEANPLISQADLADVIREETPGLSDGQATGRAATLLTFERKEAS